MKSILHITTTSGEKECFKGELADLLFKSIDEAGAGNSEWSRCKYKDVEYIYILRNICSISYIV